MTQKNESLDFNRVEELTRVEQDPRMNELSNDERWWLAQSGIDKQEFLRNGVNAKFQIIYDDKAYIFRPLSMQEEHECDWFASDDYNKLAEHRRNAAYKVYRFKLYQLAKASVATPASDTAMQIKDFENMPSHAFLGLFSRYYYAMQYLNADIDRMTNVELNNMIKEIEEEPSLVGKLSPQHSQRIILELLAANMLLRGKSLSESPTENSNTETTGQK